MVIPSNRRVAGEGAVTVRRRAAAGALVSGTFTEESLVPSIPANASKCPASSTTANLPDGLVVVDGWVTKSGDTANSSAPSSCL